MADRRGVLVPILIIAFIFLTPGPAPQVASRLDVYRPTAEDILAEEEFELAVLRNASYGDINGSERPLNLTGLEDDRGYAWDALAAVQGRAKEQLRYALGDWGDGALGAGTEAGISSAAPSLYRNATGFLSGKWLRSPVEASVVVPRFNMTPYAADGPFGRMELDSFGGNITGEGGDLSVRLHERLLEDAPFVGTRTGNLTRFGAEITFADDKTSEEYEVQAYGVYDMHIGQAILTTTSKKFAGIFALPQFALSADTFELYKTFLNTSLANTVRRQQDGELPRLSNAFLTNADSANPRVVYERPDCDLIIWMQQLSPINSDGSTPNVANAVLSFIEQEFRFPTGASLPFSAPELHFSLLAFSPDCGFVLESAGPPDHTPQQSGNHLKGRKVEILYTQARHHVLLFTVTLGGQLVLLKRQMRESSTPSTRSRIAFTSIALMALGDGFATMSFLLLSLFIPGLWINLVGVAFVGFTGVAFLGMRFLLDVWNAHAPERMVRAREEADRENERRSRLWAVLERARQENRARAAAAAAGPPTDAARAATAPAPTGENTTGGTQTDSSPPPNTGTTQISVPDPGEALPADEAEPTATGQTDTPTPGVPARPVTPALRPPTDTGATPVFMPSDQEGLELVIPPGDTGVLGNPLPAFPPAEPQPSSFGSLYTRFYLILLSTLFLSLNATSWPAPVRRAYFVVLAMVYLSFWFPQIYRNILRNSRRAFDWEFVAGQSALRLVPFAYFYGYGNNVLSVQKDLYSLAFLSIWVWIQVVLLVSQEVLGPRWFLLKHDWAPNAYDYHPVLREDEEGATMPIGFSAATAAISNSTPASPDTERRPSLSSPTTTRRSSLLLKDRDQQQQRLKGKRIFDCAICMQELEVPVVESGGDDTSSLAGGLLARRAYMVTPCRHIFHSACLEGWMKYRLQCPICRETLPPL